MQNYVANAAAGLFGGAAGLANVNLFLGTTEAYIDSARINRLQDGVGGPAQSVHVGASDHSVAHDYVLSAAGGAVGAGGSLNTTVFARDTLARIEGGGDLRATDGIVVDARSSQGSASVVAGAAAGGFGGAGSANMALILGTTEARIRGRAVYAGDVSVHAHSIGRLFTSAGGAAAGVTAVAGAFAVAVDQGTSRALIENAYVETTGQVSVDAQSDTEFQTWSASGSGGSTGVAGSAVISVVQRTTESFTHNTGFGEYNNGVGGLSRRRGGPGHGQKPGRSRRSGRHRRGRVAAVTTIGNTTNAYISGGAIFVRGDVAVEAESERYLSTLAASGGLGGTTLAVNVAVILAGAHLAGDALDQLDGQDNPTLSYINAFATSDTRGDERRWPDDPIGFQLSAGRAGRSSECAHHHG